MKTKRLLRKLRRDVNSLLECQCALCTEVSDQDEVLRALCTQVDEINTVTWHFTDNATFPAFGTCGISANVQGGAKYDAFITMPPRDESQPICCYEGSAHIEDGHVVPS
jgi:hypothetical protein